MLSRARRVLYAEARLQAEPIKQPGITETTRRYEEALDELFKQAGITSNDSEIIQGEKFLILLGSWLQNSKARISFFSKIDKSRRLYKVQFVDYPAVDNFYIERCHPDNESLIKLTSMAGQTVPNSKHPFIKEAIDTASQQQRLSHAKTETKKK